MIAAYREAIRLRPDDATSRNNLAFALTVLPDRPRREYEEAVEHARRAVELDPMAGRSYNTLALAELRAGNPSESIAAGDRSMRLRMAGTPPTGSSWPSRTGRRATRSKPARGSTGRSRG